MLSKLLCTASLLLAAAFLLAPTDADAKRLGGGKSSGMQRSAPDKNQSTPAQPAQPGPGATPNAPAGPAAAAAPATAGAAAAAAAPKRSWMGPLAGLAAGLGLAALFSHLGLGGEMASLLLMLLIGVAAFVAIRLVMQRMAGGRGHQRLAMAGAGGTSGTASPIAPARPAAAAPMQFVDERPGMQRSGVDGHTSAPTVAIGSALATPLAVPGVTAKAAIAAPAALPADFDREGFERVARMLFIRLQAANDKADVQDLRQFTTPELFASLRLDLQDRGDAAQHTDVVSVDARLIDYALEGDQQVVSVRFTGQLKEDPAAAAEGFAEVWHLVRPQDESRNWAIAGIQQAQ